MKLTYFVSRAEKYDIYRTRLNMFAGAWLVESAAGGWSCCVSLASHEIASADSQAQWPVQFWNLACHKTFKSTGTCKRGKGNFVIGHSLETNRLVRIVHSGMTCSFVLFPRAKGLR